MLDDNIRLRAICTKADDKKCYGSQADEASAMTSLSAIELKEQQLKDTVSTHLVYNLGKSSEVFKNYIHTHTHTTYEPLD